MINFQWKILELFAEAKGVKYYVQASDESNTVDHEGNHYFSDGIVSLPISEIKERDLLHWLQNDKDIVSIENNLKSQLENIENTKKIAFPWMANTFKVEI